MKGLYDTLSIYSQTDMYPFHMPGHKRRSMDMSRPEQLDITEIYGFDNLHHATGILKDTQERAARLYGALDSFFLVNGSTCGILTAVYASVKKHGRLLMARNCHKSVYHAAELTEAKTSYLYPMETDLGIQGSISPEDVAEKLRAHPDTEAVIITSPTYDGVVSDIAAIAGIVHSYGAVFIVDEAHGAHFGFGQGFPQKAVRQGADLVIESLHKTLPSFTQTAILHRCSERIGIRTLKKYLGIFQTSSPSYVFMAGMDRLTTQLIQQGDTLFSMFEMRLKDFYDSAKDLKYLHVLPAENEDHPYAYRGIYARDKSKILISSQNTDCSGAELADILRQRFHLEPEMSSLFYVTALTSIMDTSVGFERLNLALHKLDEEYEDLLRSNTEHPTPDAQKNMLSALYSLPPKYMDICETADLPAATVDLRESAGAIVLDYVYLYPPGIPVLVPGEQMTDEHLRLLLLCQSLGYELEGMADETGKKIQIIQGELT